MTAAHNVEAVTCDAALPLLPQGIASAPTGVAAAAALFSVGVVDSVGPLVANQSRWMIASYRLINYYYYTPLSLTLCIFFVFLLRITN